MSLTYAIGDIHGALHKLTTLITRCEQHANGRVHGFVFLGDYIDRGPQSSGVISHLIAFAQKKPDVITLMGNHEELLVEIFDGRESPDGWLPQGGAETLQSYGVANARDLPREHIDWLRALRLSHDDGKRFFVHAGVNPERPLNAQEARDLMWIREPFLSDTRDYGRLIVHGHTPMRNGIPDLRSNRVDLDTAAGYGGPLTAAVFSDEETRPLEFLFVS
ncbi:MAG TPA: metallophosphoesterase family protein [Xanthobacteraceae bacterium]|jgi:serine/threonine protein phosphatase 1|nr:metallophosphoesterase family protein [Xanthobacteraceae bacterium]